MRRYLPIFAGYAVVELSAEIFRDSYPLVHFFTKPLLMILLFGFLYQITQKKRTKTDKLLLLSLVFSWFGDLFLLFKSDLYFLLGLGSFLVAHILYIVVFQRGASLKKGSYAIFTLFLLILYGFGLMYLVFPSIRGPLKIPVAVYASTILMMVWVMTLRRGRVASGAFGIGLVGAILFMFSDSLIAISSFTKIPIPYPHVAIMGLYLVGQYCLVESYVRERDLAVRDNH